MRRKQLATILLSAIMAVSACVPVNGISAAAVENAGAESKEESLALEVPDETFEPVTEKEAQTAQGETEQASDAPTAQGETEQTSDAPTAREETEKDSEDATTAETAIETSTEKAASGEAAPAADESAETEEASAKEEPAEAPPAAAQEEPAPAEEPSANKAPAAAPPTSAAAEDPSAQVIEEEAREETGRPALRALQPKDFKNAGEISAGDKKSEDAFSDDDYAVWKFTPKESGSYCFSSDSSLPIYLMVYDADYNEIAYERGDWYSVERYFRKGMTYYLAAELADPIDKEEIRFYVSISLEQLEMPDLYVEGNYESEISVPYGEEVVLSVFALSSTGEIYYEWGDSDKILGTSDSITFTPERNTTIYCMVSDGPDEETARSEYKRFDVSIENHLTVQEDGEYESDNGQLIKSVGFGDPATFKVTASADDDSRLTYKWSREEVSMVADEDGGLVPWREYVTIEGEETNAYEIASAEESGNYCCTVTDRFGNRRSQYFDLRVSNLGSAYPEGAKEGDDTVSLSAEYGSALTLRIIVKAADLSKVTFEWYRVQQVDDDSWSDWELITEADTAEYEIKSVKAGERYRCIVSDGANEFSLEFDVNVENPLSVKAEGAKENESNTARLYAEAGSSLTLRAIVSAPQDSKLKYTWSSSELEFEEDVWEDVSYNFETIKGANKAEYRVEHAEERVYKCDVSDQHGNRAEAFFYVYTENRLRAYPAGDCVEDDFQILHIKALETPTLRVIAEAADTSGITYQWQKMDYDSEEDGGVRSIDIRGATEDSYRPDISEGLDYRCVVRDQYGNSAEVYISLNVDNELHAYPEGAVDGSQTVDLYPGLGDTVTLKVKAEALDDSRLTYKWRDEDGTKYEAAQDELVIESAAQAQIYTCEVTDQYGNWSEAVFNIVIENHLRAYPEGNENTDTLEVPVLPLSSVTLRVVAEADDMSGLTYQWSNDYDPIEGADTDTYTIPSVDSETKYTCEVRDRYNNRKTVTFHVSVDNRFAAYPEGAEEGKDTVDVYGDYGQPLTLRAIVNAYNKEGIVYEWDSYDRKLTGSASGNEYTIDAVTEPETFFCYVVDGFGHRSFVYFKVYVENHFRAYPEGYEGHDATTIYAKPGSKVTLSAVVEADDREDLFTWWEKYQEDEFDPLDEQGNTLTVDAEEATYVFVAWDKYETCRQVRFNIKLSEDIRPLDISEAAVTVSDTIYNGTERKPAVRVAYKGCILKKGTDYSVSYENNVNAGVKTAKAVVTGSNTALSGKKEAAFSILPGKTARGDMFNLAGNVKVTWKAVPGARYYKVYREGVTNASESVSEPVIVTSRLVGWDKSPGLVNGHAYRYRIVASLTGGSGGAAGGGAGDAAGGGAGGAAGGGAGGTAGRGAGGTAGGGAGDEAGSDLSGDSPLSYSKLMYRLKTVVIRRVKNTEPGKVTVWFDKTTSGDSYVLQYSENENMAGAKTKVVQGAATTSYTIGGLTKGKTYYISIRVRKKVGGINYYTTFGTAKKIMIEK